jgi:hypothetical protein
MKETTFIYYKRQSRQMIHMSVRVQSENAVQRWGERLAIGARVMQSKARQNVAATFRDKVMCLDTKVEQLGAVGILEG